VAPAGATAIKKGLSMENIKFYSPLSIKIDDTNYNYHDPPDDYSEDDSLYYDYDSMVDLPEDEYINFIDDINLQLSKSLGESCNLAKYCYSTQLAEKLNSINIETVEFGDQLYAVTIVYIEEEIQLSDDDVSDIQEYITGQFSDGFGESFEQIPITTNDGDIYVSLWSPKYWDLSPTPPQTIKETNDIQAAYKPDAPMIGADGNIFNQLSIAKKALKDNRQGYDAKEMAARVMNSNSYDEALRIITEYVNPVDKKEYDRKSAKRIKPMER